MVEKNNVKIRTLLLLMVSVITLFTICSYTIYADETIVAEGNITDTVSYKLYTDNLLVISGEGEIVAQASWQNTLVKANRNAVTKVIIEEGITKIGDNAFYKNQNACFVNMESIVFPSTLLSIGSNAFGGTTPNGDVALKDVEFDQSGKLTEIGNGAFGGCKSLQNIVIPEGVTKLGNYVFDYCTGLETISFPSTITEYGVSILAGCTSMKTITFNAMVAAPLDYIRSGQSGEGYAGLDGYIYQATLASADGCLRKTNGHDVIMKHPVGATGYSDDDPTPTDGWGLYAENTWESFSLVPEEVQAVIKLIDKIGEVTADNYTDTHVVNSIKAAREAYDALESQDLKDKVSNYTDLTDAEAAVESFKLDASKTSAKGDLDALLTGKTESDYDAEDWTVLNAAINSGKEEIDAATTIEEVNTAKSAAESAVSAIKTKEQKAAEEADKIKKQKAAAKKYTVKGLKVKAKNRKFTVSWKKTVGATGYQVQYKLKSAKKYKTLKTLKKLKVTSKKFKKGKKYQFKVRTYTNVNGTKVYGKWTKVKTIKCR